MNKPCSMAAQDPGPHLSPELRHRVEAATVRFRRWGGQGVLVPGRLIVTAAHVIQWSAEGHMALREFVEEIEAGGRRLRITPMAVEPVADIAVLGALDDQAYLDDAEAFEAFCESTAPVPLCTGDASGRVHVFTHTGRWVAGHYPAGAWEKAEASRFRRMHGNDPRLFIATDEPIEGGTSGSPIVTEGGLLVGVMSVGQYTEGKRPDRGERSNDRPPTPCGAHLARAPHDEVPALIPFARLEVG